MEWTDVFIRPTNNEFGTLKLLIDSLSQRSCHSRKKEKKENQQGSKVKKSQHVQTGVKKVAE